MLGHRCDVLMPTAALLQTHSGSNPRARGVILVPVKREEAWSWALEELFLDWWDIPPDKKIFESSKGTPVHSSDGWRLVLFHAQEPEGHHQAPRRHRRSMRTWND